MHRKHPIELRVPSKAERTACDLSAFQCSGLEGRVDAEISPKSSEAFVSMSQKTDSMQALVSTLKNDKLALKDALRTAIGKRDELSIRLQTAHNTAVQEAKKAEMCLLEASHAQQVISHLSRELDERTSRLEQLSVERDMLLRENDSLKRELDRLRQPPKQRHGRTASDLTTKETDISREVGKYGNFIVAKLGGVPELQALFRGRAYSTKYFQEIVQKSAYAEGFLTMLQFISDILVFETHKKGANSSPKAVDGSSFAFQTSRTSSHRHSGDVDTTQSDSSSGKPQIPSLKLTPERGESPLLLWNKDLPLKFSKESRSAGNSPKRGVTSRQKEPSTPHLGTSSEEQT